MRPIDFVIFDGDSSPNDPIYKVAGAMMKPITVLGLKENFVIRGYYLGETGMVLEIEPIKNS